MPLPPYPEHRRMDCDYHHRSFSSQLNNRLVGPPTLGLTHSAVGSNAKSDQRGKNTIICPSFTCLATVWSNTPGDGQSSPCHAHQTTMRKGNGQIGPQQKRPRIPRLNGTKSLEESEQSVGDLSKGELLAQTDPRPAAKGDVLPTERATVSNPQVQPSLLLMMNTYLTRRLESHRSGRNSSASGPNTSLFRCSPWLVHRTGVPFGTRIGWLPSLPPPRGRMVSLLDVLEFVATGLKRRNAGRRVSGVKSARLEKGPSR